MEICVAVGDTGTRAKGSWPVAPLAWNRGAANENGKIKSRSQPIAPFPRAEVTAYAGHVS
jgi:hypothetical protein